MSFERDGSTGGSMIGSILGSISSFTLSKRSAFHVRILRGVATDG